MSLHELVIGFDADDTLWHNETIFERVHERYRALLAQYHDAPTVDRTLFATEMRNLDRYGYGIKGFTLSAIETAIELTQGRIRADEINQLIKLGHEMLARGLFLAPVDYPSVPQDKVRFRAAVTAIHTRADLDEALSIIEDTIVPRVRRAA